MITSLLVLGVICLMLSIALPVFGIALGAVIHILAPILAAIFVVMLIGALIGFFVRGGGKKN